MLSSLANEQINESPIEEYLEVRLGPDDSSNPYFGRRCFFFRCIIRIKQDEKEA